MKICKDGRIWGQNNKEAGNHLGILSGRKHYYKYKRKFISDEELKKFRRENFIKIGIKNKFNKGRTSWNKGKTKEEYPQLSNGGVKKGTHFYSPTQFKKGYKLSLELIQKLKEVNKGNKYSYGRKLSNRHKEILKLTHKGEKNHNWKGGITPLINKIRNLLEARQWRKTIFQRDNFTCQECKDNRGGNLVAHHHKKKFNIIFQEFLQQYSQFSLIDDKETLVRLAITYEPFWNIDNGITLCENCHKLKELMEVYNG